MPVSGRIAAGGGCGPMLATSRSRVESTAAGPSAQPLSGGDHRTIDPAHHVGEFPGMAGH